MTSSILALVVLAASAVAVPSPSPAPTPEPAAGPWIAVPYPCIAVWEFFGDGETPASQLHGFVVSQRVKDRIWNETAADRNALFWAWDKANARGTEEQRRKAFDAMFGSDATLESGAHIPVFYSGFEMRYRLCERLMGPAH
jgi:hypothetical protein